ncbi:MAG TPA: hypothetical protein VGS41_17585 [Chthonomonadales bacterium]|nr:hypothetical protein [Chthonomonadales bacterium]
MKNLLPAALAAAAICIGAPAMANNRLGAKQDEPQSAPPSTAPWRTYNEHPPNPAGLTNVEAMTEDADDMLGIIQDMRSSAAAIPPQITAATSTLTQIATLIDGINARHNAAPGAAPAPSPTPGTGQ